MSFQYEHNGQILTDWNRLFRCPESQVAIKKAEAEIEKANIFTKKP